MKGLLLLALVLTGCTIGSKGRDLVQAHGATVALAVRVEGRQQILAGELLAVEPDALLIDSVDPVGQPRAVVRVPKPSIARGVVYVGTSPGSDVRLLRRTPQGMRRAAEIQLGGRALNGPLLIRLSRFPSGIPDTLLLALAGGSEPGSGGRPRDRLIAGRHPLTAMPRLFLFLIAITASAQAPRSTSEFLAATSAALEAFADPADALAAGFRPLGPDMPHMGQHWVHPGRAVSRDLDPTRPAMLTYLSLGDRTVLTGAAFTIPIAPGAAPPSFPSPGAWPRRKHPRALSGRVDCASSLSAPMSLFSSDPLTHFPVVKGKRLDGTEVQFPYDLPSDATLLVVSFMDDRDPLSDQWARLGERIKERHPDRFSVIEVPVVNVKLKLLGGLATMGIRGQVDDDAEHARTVPIFVDLKPFQKKLKVKTRGVYPMLVARDGRIAWRGEDEIDMDEITALEDAVVDLLAAPVPDVTEHPDVEAPDAKDEDLAGDTNLDDPSRLEAQAPDETTEAG